MLLYTSCSKARDKGGLLYAGICCRGLSWSVSIQLHTERFVLVKVVSYVLYFEQNRHILSQVLLQILIRQYVTIYLYSHTQNGYDRSGEVFFSQCSQRTFKLIF